MDARLEFLNQVKQGRLAAGNFLGLVHILVGRRIAKSDGTLVSNGVSWRDAAGLLKKVRWDKSAVIELSLNPKQLPPRDREKYWYAAIAQAGISSAEAIDAANKLAARLFDNGYEIGEAPGQGK